MRRTLGGLLMRDFDGLFRRGTVPAGDRALLDWFLSEGDEAAFEAIVARHGPMVRGVCRRLLGSSHDADDAFQATFLVLVRKARHLRDSDRLGPWLYGVATKVAIRSRSRSASRRDRHEASFDDFPARDDRGRSDWLDVWPILDVELGRIPAKYREVLILCLLEGSTVEEAAGRLSCPLGTVKSRLARGREALKSRLTSRGIAPAVALAVVAGTSSTAFASPVSEALIRTTMTTIARGGVAPGIVALTQGVAPSMFPKSIAMTALLCGGIAVSVLGAAGWMKASARVQEPGPGAATAPVAEAGGAGLQQNEAQTKIHLREILLAFHNYANVNGHFAPAAIYGSDGKPKLSWRVALLPYLGREDLYKKFHLDESWDSPHNKPLTDEMPGVFGTPMAPMPQGVTRIQGFVGKGAMFEGSTGTTIESVTDGTSNTIMVALGKAPVLWSQPVDMPFGAGEIPAMLYDGDPNGYLVATGDGSVKTVPKSQARMLKYLVTRNGGEVIDGNIYASPPNPSEIRPATTALPTPSLTPLPLAPGGGAMAGGMASAMPPATAPDLDQRLKRLEEKLDRILQKLESTQK